MTIGRNEGQLLVELQHLLNKFSIENGSNTPDFMLANYLVDCLKTFDSIVNAREQWYGRQNDQLPGPFIPKE